MADDMAQLSLLNKRYSNKRPATRHTRSEVAEHGSVYSEPASPGASTRLVKQPRTGVVRAHTVSGAYDTPVSDTSCRRTCSNTLLNVYTIDDAFRRKNNRNNNGDTRSNASGSQPERNANETREQPTPTSKSILRRRSTGSARRHQSAGILRHNARNDVSNSYMQTSSASPADVNDVAFYSDSRAQKTHIHVADTFLNSETQHVNGAVVAAFANLENSKQVTHNTARTGLYVSESQGVNAASKPHKESARFRKLNRTLRRRMGEQYSHGSELSYKLRQRNVHNRPSTTPTRITSQSSFTSHTQDVTSQKQQPMKRGVTFGESPTTIDTTALGNPEHFLEMLMEMDQNRNSDDTNNTLSLHTFVYI